MGLRKFSLAVAAVAVMSLCSFADGIVWPADFWQQVTNHVEAVAPSGDQIGTSEEKSDWIYVSSLFALAYGTIENPLDTRLLSFSLSPEVEVESFGGGLMLFVR